MFKQFQFIDNRIYCEYYKLHQYIHNYINKDFLIKFEKK